MCAEVSAADRYLAQGLGATLGSDGRAVSQGTGGDRRHRLARKGIGAMAGVPLSDVPVYVPARLLSSCVTLTSTHSGWLSVATLSVNWGQHYIPFRVIVRSHWDAVTIGGLSPVPDTW